MSTLHDTFWQQFGGVLFGQPREPQSESEWIAAGKALRGLVQLDQLAQRLEQATKLSPSTIVSAAQTRRQHPEAGSVEYDGNGDLICVVHKRPMKQGRFGWYCPAKDPNGKNGYCTFTIKDV